MVLTVMAMLRQPPTGMNERLSFATVVSFLGPSQVGYGRGFAPCRNKRMEGSSSTENCPPDSVARPVFRGLSVWWIRILLFIAHLALLVAAASLTPSNYAFQLGAVAGSVILVSTPLLWLLLWYARQRRTVLLFCGLVLAQTGLIAFVAIQFRAEDRVVREIEAEGVQRQGNWAAQRANFHLERVFEMLTPGNEFHAEELPGLLEQARSATVTDREQWDQTQAWASDAEKRLAAVNLRVAADFRRGFESTRARNERVQALNKEYFTGIEKLVTLLIDKQGLYHTTQAGPTFDRQQDAEAYNQVLKGLNTTKEKVDAELRSKSHQ
jgi:hypothetical protein